MINVQSEKREKIQKLEIQIFLLDIGIAQYSILNTDYLILKRT